MAMVTAPSGLRTRSLMTFQLCSAGGIFGAMPNAASTSSSRPAAGYAPGTGEMRRAELGRRPVIETGGVIRLRHGIDVVDVPRLDHGAFAHVAEQAELAPLFLG